MAGRPIKPVDFLSEAEIQVLRDKMRELYDLFVEESDIDAWRKITNLREREQAKRNANQSLLMIKPLTVIVMNLCAQFEGNDDADREAKELAEEIKKFEKKVK